MHATARRSANFRTALTARSFRKTPVVQMGLLDAIFGPKPTPTQLAPKQAPPGLELATFAGGCFWGLELAYQRVPGVVATTVGYTGGQQPNPSYDEVCSGFTGHTEAVQVTYNPQDVGYDQLLHVFFERVDPTTRNQQGNDRGTQYRSGIFWHTEAQRAAAEAKIREVNDKLARGERVRSGRGYEGNRVVSDLAEAGDYYIAEAYHQQYLEKGGQSAAKGDTSIIRCYG